MKDPLILINHILESISLINKYTENSEMSDFLARKETQNAVIRRLEIIGEASNKLPSDFKEKHPDIPWRKLAGMRNILIHEYFGVDLNLTWNVIKDELPKLENKIKTITG